jgi:hypothetical protein
MINRRIIQPADDLVLTKDPRLVWIPVFDDQVCGVCAHEWDLGKDDVRFFLDVEDTRGEALLEVASFPRDLFSCMNNVRQALYARQDALMSPRGTKTITIAPNLWNVKTKYGIYFQILAFGCSLEGPYAEFIMAVRGSPPGSRPVNSETLRFPICLLSEDFNVVRNW